MFFQTLRHLGRGATHGFQWHFDWKSVDFWLLAVSNWSCKIAFSRDRCCVFWVLQLWQLQGWWPSGVSACSPPETYTTWRLQGWSWAHVIFAVSWLFTCFFFWFWKLKFEKAKLKSQIGSVTLAQAPLTIEKSAPVLGWSHGVKFLWGMGMQSKQNTSRIIFWARFWQVEFKKTNWNVK